MIKLIHKTPQIFSNLLCKMIISRAFTILSQLEQKKKKFTNQGYNIYFGIRHLKNTTTYSSFNANYTTKIGFKLYQKLFIICTKENELYILFFFVTLLWLSHIVFYQMTHCKKRYLAHVYGLKDYQGHLNTFFWLSGFK